MSDQQKDCYGFVQIPNNEKLMPALLRYADEVARLAGFSSEASGKLQLALEEACLDVIKNAFAPNEQAEFDVAFYRRLDGLEIHIHDMGLPYDPNMAPSYDPKGDITNQNLDGLGSFLINNMVDEYQYNNLGIRGKETVLIKYFDTPSIADETEAPAEPEVVKPPLKEDIVPVHFNIRLMKPEEAMEVCRCIYDCYGYSYANENIYYPERVAAMNKSGQLCSAVAVTDDGEIGGHFALIYYDTLPAEVGIAVTKKKFRGQGFARQLGEKLAEEAVKGGLNGLQIKEVTAHPYTQKFCSKLGYKDCGILLAHSPKTLSFKGIADKLKQRNSDVLGFMYLKPPNPISIYPPEHHSEMIGRLFNNIGVEVTCMAVDEEPVLAETTVMSVDVHALRSLAVIGITEYGPDLATVLRQELRKLFMDEIRVIELYLSLDNPVTAGLVADLEKVGFMFTGVLPETVYGNAIIMQYFNGEHIEYDELVIVSELAKDLLEYIKKYDPALN